MINISKFNSTTVDFFEKYKNPLVWPTDGVNEKPFYFDTNMLVLYLLRMKEKHATTLL